MAEQDRPAVAAVRQPKDPTGAPALEMELYLRIEKGREPRRILSPSDGSGLGEIEELLVASIAEQTGEEGVFRVVLGRTGGETEERPARVAEPDQAVALVNARRLEDGEVEIGEAVYDQATAPHEQGLEKAVASAVAQEVRRLPVGEWRELLLVAGSVTPTIVP